MSNQLARSDVSYYSPTTFTLATTMAGPWAPISVAITARLYQGGLVTLTFPSVLATSTISSPSIVTVDALPSVYRPATQQSLSVRVLNAANSTTGRLDVFPGGGLTFTLDGGNFTGGCGVPSMSVTYQV